MRVLLTTTIAAALITGCSTAPGVIHGRTVELHRESSVAGEKSRRLRGPHCPTRLESSKTARATVCGQIEQNAGIFSVQLKTDGYVSDCGLPKTGKPYVLVNGTATDVRENHLAGELAAPWLSDHALVGEVPGRSQQAASHRSPVVSHVQDQAGQVVVAHLAGRRVRRPRPSSVALRVLISPTLMVPLNWSVRYDVTHRLGPPTATTADRSAVHAGI